jgi:hypothetical protein
MAAMFSYCKSFLHRKQLDFSLLNCISFAIVPTVSFFLASRETNPSTYAITALTLSEVVACCSCYFSDCKTFKLCSIPPDWYMSETTLDSS